MCFLQHLVSTSSWLLLQTQHWINEHQHVRKRRARAVVCRSGGGGGGGLKIRCSTDTEEASYRRKPLLQMSDAVNRVVSSCFCLPSLDCITATFAVIPKLSWIIRIFTIQAGVLHKHHILVGLMSTSKWITGWMKPALN